MGLVNFFSNSLWRQQSQKSHCMFCWKPITCAVDTERGVACLQNTTLNISTDGATEGGRDAGAWIVTWGPVRGIPQTDACTPCHHHHWWYCSTAESPAGDTLRHTDAVGHPSAEGDRLSRHSHTGGQKLCASWPKSALLPGVSTAKTTPLFNHHTPPPGHQAPSTCSTSGIRLRSGSIQTPGLRELTGRQEWCRGPTGWRHCLGTLQDPISRVLPYTILMCPCNLLLYSLVIALFIGNSKLYLLVTVGSVYW